MTASSPAEAVSNGHDVGSYDTGMCQRYLREQCWRVPSVYASAIEAWNGAKYKHPGDRHPPAGAPTYYRGGNYGHAVLTCHGGIRSTDCQTSYDVSDIDVGWPERAWGYEYLGWTEDINGVHVIKPKEEDMPLTDEDIEKIAKRVNRALGDYDASGDQRDKGDPKHPDTADERIRQIENVVREVEAKVDKIAKAVGA